MPQNFTDLSTTEKLPRNFPGFQALVRHFLICSLPRGIPAHVKKPRSALEKFLSLESFYDILHVLFRSFSTQEILSLGLFPGFHTAFQTSLR